VYPGTSVENQESQAQDIDVLKHRVGDMVRAKYIRKTYVPEILQLSEENQEYYLRFMKRKSNGTYMWPKIVDELWVDAENILDVIFIDNEGVLHSEESGYYANEAEPVQTQESNSLRYQNGSMVKATYLRKNYVAKVLDYDTENNEYLLSFMVKSRNVKYVWPKNKDELWVLPKTILGFHEEA
jgi:hypothetical protein